jgi:hypothetical protein
VVEILSLLSPAMTVYFDSIAIPIARKALAIGLQMCANASASRSLLNAQITDPSERAWKRDLRDKMDGDEPDNRIVFNSHGQLSIRVNAQLQDLFPDEALRPGISQLSEQISYSVGVCRRCADLSASNTKPGNSRNNIIP